MVKSEFEIFQTEMQVDFSFGSMTQKFLDCKTFYTDINH